MRLALLMVMLWLAAVSRCDEPRQAPPPERKAGDYVKLRGTLSDDVDCRIFKEDGGKTYSLNTRLRNYPNGSKVCIHGTIAEASQCLVTPTLDVQSVGAWSSCP